MTILFDGRQFAREKETVLRRKVESLRAKKIIPKLDSIVVGTDPASILYVGLKKKAAERIGCEVRIKQYPETITKAALITEIEKLNDYSSVNGIMVQLPLPVKFSPSDRDAILDKISPRKDVDGMRTDSGFIAPTAKAVAEILSIGLSEIKLSNPPLYMTVVGGSGFEGGQIIRVLSSNFKDWTFDITSADSKTDKLSRLTLNSDVIISVTGVADLIREHMVKEGSVLIDVGSPKGDIEKNAYTKASFVSPVPGGVGPVTISCLLENLVNSAVGY